MEKLEHWFPTAASKVAIGLLVVIVIMMIFARIALTEGLQPTPDKSNVLFGVFPRMDILKNNGGK